jgi:hypothetical protein
MHCSKPLPLFEEFLNQRTDQQREMIFVYPEQLKGHKITDDIKFTGSGSTFSPVNDKDWLPEGEYEIADIDNEYARLISDDNIYWVTRYDYEEAKSDLLNPVAASGNDAVLNAKVVLDNVAKSKAMGAPYVFQPSKPAGDDAS